MNHNKQNKTPVKSTPNHQPLWDAIKKNKTASVIAHPALHKKIIKAIINKKYKDAVFKLECDMIDEVYTLQFKSEDKILTFTLQPRLSIRIL